MIDFDELLSAVRTSKADALIAIKQAMDSNPDLNELLRDAIVCLSNRQHS